MNKIFFLLALIASISFSPAFAQEVAGQKITVTTDNSAYQQGDIITVSGNIEKILPEMEYDIERLQQVSRRFSKMGSKPEMAFFDLSKRIEGVLSYLNRRIPTLGKKVDLVNDIDQDIKIMANGTLISWTIENLIRNSIDSISGEAGLIRISMSQDQNNVKIRISDNGCGVPKKDWKNIFRPGFSTKKSGWGLGLSLCQRIINEVHKGDIYVLESRINSGTVFEINIPSG